MKKFLLSVFTVLLSSSLLLAQAPQGFNYQGVVKNEFGEIISQQEVSLKISIIEYTTDGNAVYSELHKVTTAENGLFTVVIGKGKAINGDFATINWGDRNHYTKIEIDPTGGSNYEDLGTSQLLSVPYAMYAGKAGQVDEVKSNKRISLDGGDPLEAENNVIHSNDYFISKNKKDTLASGTLQINPVVSSNSQGDTIQNTVINPDGGFVGIGVTDANLGTTNTDYRLQVSGGIETDSIQITNGAAKDLVLTSDSTGKATWQLTQDNQDLSVTDVAGNKTAKIVIADGTDITLVGGNNINIEGINDTITINATGTATNDTDWLKTNGNSPTSVNDSIYTLGRVGIGTNTPFAKLHVVGDVRLQATRSADRDNDSTARSNNIPSLSSGGLVQNSPLTTKKGNVFADSNLTVSNTVTAPVGVITTIDARAVKTDSLRVVGGTSGQILVSDSLGNANWATPDTVSSDMDWALTTRTVDSTLFTDMITDSTVNGNVGIGTNTPFAKLHIAGNLRINQVDAQSATGPQNLLSISEGGGLVQKAPIVSRTFSINDSTEEGRIGINTAAPSGALHVKGRTFLDSTLFVKGDIIPADSTTGFNLGSITRPWNTLFYRGQTMVISDRRLKKNIANLTEHGLSSILSLQVRKFNYINNDELRYGFVAQEFKKVMPELVYEGEDEEKTLAIGYTDLIPILVKAIQEQQKEIEVLKKELKIFKK